LRNVLLRRSQKSDRIAVRSQTKPSKIFGPFHLSV